MNFQELFGATFPIIQAPMAGVQGAKLAVAVSNAGGLGSLPCAMLSTDALQKELQVLQSGTTKPYNVNFFCHIQPKPDDDRETRWRETLLPYFQELGVDPNSIINGPGRFPFNHDSADVLENFKPKVVSFHFGLPPSDLVTRVKSWGTKIVSSATTVEEALWLQDHGVDAIIAQGLEAGGHRGMFLNENITTQIGTLALLPQVVASVQVPVIAAGGIANAASVAAAMALGAAGVQVGTAFLLCHEATTSSVHKAALSSAQSNETALTNLFSGRPARGIVNRIMREKGPMSTTVPAFPFAPAALAPLRACAEASGSGDFSPLWAGQNASNCKAVPASDLVRELAAFDSL
jgi:nitronate monooxygenase